MPEPELTIDTERFLDRLDALARIGATPDGGVHRLTLSDEDRAARDRVVAWFEGAALEVTVDAMGNIFGTRAGSEDGPPVMTGSHVDTVAHGGRYDGALGVLAALEAVETLNDAGVATRRPLCVAVFTNEEGARFQPDMMGSLVFAGGATLDEAHAATDADGITLGDDLARIGYDGTLPCGTIRPHAFVELHIEQGPLLEREGTTIGAVDSLQGISWTELRFRGQTNHAGTTPMPLRRDAGLCAAATAAFVRSLVDEIGGEQVGTVGELALEPGVINVVPGAARLTVDLRNTDDASLDEATARVLAFAQDMAEREGVECASRRLARFPPVRFDAGLVEAIERAADSLGHTCRRMTSGAGHDAQMLARVCPSAMIFVPSRDGISHSPAEHTEPEHLVAGANVLLRTVLALASRD